MFEVSMKEMSVDVLVVELEFDVVDVVGKGWGKG